MSLNDVEKNLDGVDSILTKITNIVKKHWLILIALSILAFGYYVFTLDEPTVSDDQQEQSIQ